jgi:M6 family metalloprotease-like protein
MRSSLTVSALLLPLVFGSFAIARSQQSSATSAPPALDPQRVQDQDEMTWADYRPIPNTNWAGHAVPPGRPIRVALVAIDFEDQPFVVTRPKQSDPFGNPQIDAVRREDVAKFYAGFWGTPGPLNHGHTIDEYWMEQSRGRVGIPKFDPYGPYRMPRKLFEYGLNEYNQTAGCPGGYTCNGRMEPDADALWAADAGADIRSRYDVVLRIYAGYDETTVWQEFGEMKFRSRDEIPAAWGNPDPSKPRWVTTRYVPWTSWLAGAQQWGLSSVRQGESSGTITHETPEKKQGVPEHDIDAHAEMARYTLYVSGAALVALGVATRVSEFSSVDCSVEGIWRSSSLRRDCKSDGADASSFSPSRVMFRITVRRSAGSRVRVTYPCSSSRSRIPVKVA